MNNQFRRERIAFLNGYEAAVLDYAIWKDGVQQVGCMQRDAKEVLLPIRKERKELMELIEKEPHNI